MTGFYMECNTGLRWVNSLMTIFSSYRKHHVEADSAFSSKSNDWFLYDENICY